MGPTDERRGIVVGHSDLGDADRIVRVLTAEDGRIEVLARGARSSRKRFGGLLDIGNRIRFTLAGRGRLPRFDQVDLVAGVDRARRDLERIALLAYGCEVAGRLAGEGAPASRLARLLVVWLDLLEGEALPGVASRQAFEAKALAFCGVLPSLAVCAVCGRPAPTHLAFDSGPVHAVCGHGADVGAAALARLDALLHTPLFDTPGLEPSSATWALSDLVQHHLGATLRSRALLAEIGG